jgi:hypothetical protein
MAGIRRSLLSVAVLAVIAAFSGATAPAGAAQTAVAHSRAPVRWSLVLGPVTGAAAAATPAVTPVVFPGGQAQTLLFWARANGGSSGSLISYASSASPAANTWSSPALAGKALTVSPPSVATCGDKSATRVILAWEDSQGNQIRFSVGTPQKGGTLSFGPGFPIPGATTSGGPTVYCPLHSADIFVTWRAVGHTAVRFVIGSPAAGSVPVKWGHIGSLPKSASSAPPAATEVSTGSKTGRLYVLWKGPQRVARIYRTWTSVPLSRRPRWAAPQASSPSTRTVAPPASVALGATGGYPLMVVYRPPGSTLRYLLLAANGNVNGDFRVPGLTSLTSVAVSQHVVAAKAARSPNIFFQIIRRCPGCKIG